MAKSEIVTLSVGKAVESFKIKSTLSVRTDTITYLGYNPQIRRNVTITEFLPQQFASRASDGQTLEVNPTYRDEFEHALSGFLQQARAWSQIHDPQIIRVTHYFQANGTAYLVMDYEKGQSLDVYLSKRKTPLAEKEIAAGGDRYQTPEWVLEGFPEEMNAITDKIYSDFNEEHGTDYRP